MLLLWRSRFGFIWSDEPYYFETANRFIQGDMPIVNDWYTAQVIRGAWYRLCMYGNFSLAVILPDCSLQQKILQCLSAVHRSNIMLSSASETFRSGSICWCSFFYGILQSKYRDGFLLCDWFGSYFAVACHTG